MSRAERTPDAMTPLSVWGVRLAAVLSVALAIGFGWTWMETFYRGVSVNVQLSFKSFDAPALPGLHFAGPIFGHHYFGDFQVPLEYARGLRHSVSPYLGSAPEQYPPSVQVLFVPLTLLPLHASALVYLGLSAAIFLIPMWLLLAPVSPAYRFVFLIPVAVLTTPFISFLDRGNTIGITVGLVAFAIWAWKSERPILCAVFLVAAISLKAYPAALLVVPLAFRRYKFTALVAGGAAAVNLLVIAVYPGGFMQNIRQVLPALRSAYSPLSQLSSWSLYSVLPKTVGLAFGQSTANGLLGTQNLAIWLPSIVYMVGLYVVIRRGRVPQWCWGPLTLATMQLAVPVSYVYTTAWASVAAVWFAAGHFADIGSEVRTRSNDTGFITLRIMLLLGLTVTLVPSIFTISGADSFQIAAATYLSPVLLLLTLCTAIVHSLQPTRVEKDASPLVKQLASLP